MGLKGAKRQVIAKNNIKFTQNPQIAGTQEFIKHEEPLIEEIKDLNTNSHKAKTLKKIQEA